MAFVLDAFMTMSWCFADERTPCSQDVLNALLSSYAAVPALWPVEVANVLAINERKQRITPLGPEEFLRTLAGLDIRIELQKAIAESERELDGTGRVMVEGPDMATVELHSHRIADVIRAELA